MAEYVATWERDWERKVEEAEKRAFLNTKMRIAKVMLERGLSLVQISEITRRPLKDIEELAEIFFP